MRKTPVILFVLLLFAGPALAQEGDKPEIRGTAFAAPGGGIGGDFTTLRFGGMAETVWSNGVGFAIDASYLTPSEDLGQGIGMVAPAGLYVFRAGTKLEPYVRGGVNLLFAEGSSAWMWHYGGGVNYWAKENLGLKVEARHSLFFEDISVGLVDVMVGAVFKF